MAGSGKRFSDAGFSEIKPLIKVHGKTMIEYVVDFFPGETDFVFICANEHLKNLGLLKEELLRIKPTAKIIGIDYQTQKGPVWGVIWAMDAIDNDLPTIFSYCDYNIFWQYNEFKKFALETNADGIVVSYTGLHPHLLGPNFYAGVKTDEKGKILEIKEKHSYAQNKMDSWHSCGMYYFKSGKLAKEAFKKHAQGPAHENGEYYISTVYNELITEGRLCLNYPIDFFCQWGTPEDLKEYELWTERARKGYIAKDKTEADILNYWQKFFNHKLVYRQANFNS